LFLKRISDELADSFHAAAGGGGEEDGAREATALVVSPFGKVWRVEVGRDGEGAFLGRGWAEFLHAHDIGVGWFVLLRHEGSAALTVRAFDTSFCVKEFAAPAAGKTFGSNRIYLLKYQDWKFGALISRNERELGTRTALFGWTICRLCIFP
jgi:hypothetical protein